MKWRRMRRGLADLHRRGTVAQQVNDRYLDALSNVDDSARLQQILEPIEKSIRWKGRPVRALHPFSSEDGTLLKIVNQGDLMIQGISNQALRAALFPQGAVTVAETKRRSALVSRKLRLLRAHGILRKITGRNLYQVTDSGRRILSAVLIARQATAKQLMKNAA